MTLFKNTAPVELSFELDGVPHQVPVGGTCEIEDRVAYAVGLLRLPLVPTALVAAPALATPEQDPVAKPYTDQEIESLEDAAFLVPKNASRKTLHEMADRFGLGRPPGSLPNKDFSRALALKLDELRQDRDARRVAQGAEH